MRYHELTEKPLDLPEIEVGDEVMVGKFKNRKATVTGLTKDDHNQPVLKTTKGDQKLFRPRLSKLEESHAGKYFYHASPIPWEEGKVLAGRLDDYEHDWIDTDFYGILEKHRPRDSIGHRDAVFMCDNDDDLDAAGGSTDWVLVVEPLGPVERHDMNWSSAISCAVSDGASENEILLFARNYWDGVPSDDPLWEYLTKSVRVISCEKF